MNKSEELVKLLTKYDRDKTRLFDELRELHRQLLDAIKLCNKEDLDGDHT